MAKKHVERRDGEGFNIEKQPVFAVKNVNKVTPAEIEQLYRLHQSLYQKSRLEDPEISVRVENGDPIKVEFWSDIHFNAVTMNLDAVIARRDYIINTPGVYIVFGGDVIDGSKSEYVDTIGAAAVFADINQQIEAFKILIYYPLLEAGKVLGAVSGFGGHDEWIRRATGLSPSAALYDNAIPYVENGGKANFYFEGEEDPGVILGLAHDDGGANKPIYPFKGLIAATNADPTLDGAGSGHNHGVAGVGAIYDNESKRSVVYLKNGQRKSNNTDRKDRMYTRDFPYARVVEGDAGFIIFDGHEDGSHTVIPVLNEFDQDSPNPAYTSRTFEAIQAWNKAKQTGVYDEIVEKFKQEAGRTNMTLIKSRSEEVRYEGDPTAHSERVHYKVVPANKSKQHPIKIVPFAEARASSKYIDRNLIKAQVDEVANDPFAFAIFLREMFDKYMSGKPDRDKHFDRLMQMLAPIMTTKTLGWLHSGSMQNDAWKRPIGDNGPFLPAKEINQRYGIPILDNYSTVVLAMPNGLELAMLILDTTANNSKENIFHGPYLAMQEHRGRDVALGGKSKKSGYVTYPSGNDTQHILIPGWLSGKINIGEKGARQNAPKNRAGMIVNPLNGDVNIALTEAELSDLYEAITIWNALAQSKQGLDWLLKE